MSAFRVISSATKSISRTLTRKLHETTMHTVKEEVLDSLCIKLAPKLTNEKYKGQAGRIGVIGGSLEYTGAPFFAGITALKVGADLTHIFCTRDAAPVIKSYSPELIVHPLLDNEETAQSAVQWIERLHVVVIGPGLGRMQQTFDAVTVLLNECRRLQKPLVIDADGLYLITNFPDVLKDYPAEVVLTPNKIEYFRLFGEDRKPGMLDRFGKKCTVVRKGAEDEIFDSVKIGTCSVTGSARRCGGQGDLLSGSLATFLCWALHQDEPLVKADLQVMAACYAACKLTKQCNERAFDMCGRSMTCTDMIEQIGNVFNDNFVCE